jgi:hypothetical protein
MLLHGEYTTADALAFLERTLVGTEMAGTPTAANTALPKVGVKGLAEPKELAPAKEEPRRVRELDYKGGATRYVKGEKKDAVPEKRSGQNVDPREWVRPNQRDGETPQAFAGRLSKWESTRRQVAKRLGVSLPPTPGK